MEPDLSLHRPHASVKLSPLEFPLLGQIVPVSTQRLIQASVSEGTQRVYASVLQALKEWLDGRPPTDALISEYLTLRHQAGLSPSSISLIPAAIQFASRLSGEEAPIGGLTERTMARIRRGGRGCGTGQVTGITFMEAKFLTGQIAKIGVREVRDAAMFSVMSDCMLRVSELVVMRPKDVSSVPDGIGQLHVPRSKMDQEGNGASLFMGSPTMKKIEGWIHEVQKQHGSPHPHAPLFRAVWKGGGIQDTGLSPQAVRKNLKSYAARVGLEERFSGHSFRVGTAPSLAHRGATVAQLQTVGRWRGGVRLPRCFMGTPPKASE